MNARTSLLQNLQSITVEGALLTGDFLVRLASADERALGLDGYTMVGVRLRDELSRGWSGLSGQWAIAERTLAGTPVDLKKWQKNWIEPLFEGVLEFRSLVRTQPIAIDERSFPLTHRAGHRHVPLVVCPPALSLDQADTMWADGQGGRRRSAHGLLQEYLNAAQDDLWGIVTNGRTLRLVRENPSLTRPAWVEFDLERMFREELYPDFVVFWLLCHASRFGEEGRAIDDCPLERWREAGEQEGERALDRLRDGVTDALRTLGTGFLQHPKNADLRQRLLDDGDDLDAEAFYGQLLRLVYRFLFWFTTEDRGVLLHPEAPEEARALYESGYASMLLRERARPSDTTDRYDDLWEGLQVVFEGLASGEPRLALPALGGLFAADVCPDLDGARLPNRQLLQAIHRIAWFRQGNALVRINYRDMDTEELGSVYESLLELVPRLVMDGPWRFGFLADDADEGAAGTARKLTGSYYTPDILVQQLLDTALEPLIEARRKEPEPIEALLDLRVVDPACGSGHFLLAAGRRIAQAVAELRSESGQPTPVEYREALRDAIARCVYGVDVNPLAVELCKTALWLEAVVPGRPLGFLDAHVRCGHALVGVQHPSDVETGIPADAFKPLTGDDRETCSALMSENRGGARNVAAALRMEPLSAGDWVRMPEDTLEQIEVKRAAFAAAEANAETARQRLLDDLWCSAAFIPKRSGGAARVPTNNHLRSVARGEELSEAMLEEVQRARDTVRFFHWSVSFPEMFDREDPGFDVVLGNPPWERVKLAEQEYFATRLPDIAAAPTAAARGREIAALEGSADPVRVRIYRDYLRDRRAADAVSQFVRASGRFPLTARGDVNLYALFAELALRLKRRSGRAGLVLPTGIATDDGTKVFFGALIEGAVLSSFHDIENREGIFAGVHRSYKFALVTLAHDSSMPEFSFFSTRLAHLQDSARRFLMSKEDIAAMNPNTLTCPVFRSERDKALTAAIYGRAGVLIREPRGDALEENPWSIRLTTMFHMSNDSGLFLSMEQSNCRPLYEAKMVHQFDHRWGTWDEGSIRDVSPSEKADPTLSVNPRYWVAAEEVAVRSTRVPREVVRAWQERDAKALRPKVAVWVAGALLNAGDEAGARALLRDLIDSKSGGLFDVLDGEMAVTARNWDVAAELSETSRDALLTALNAGDDCALVDRIGGLIHEMVPNWFLGFRDICRSTDERTVIASVIPWGAVGNNLPILLPSAELPASCMAALLGNLCSLVLDFVARHKVGGTHLNFFIFKQLPVLPPDAYGEADLDYIVPRVLELTFTAHDLSLWARDLGYDGVPFGFDPGRRAQLRAELDAWYAHRYGLTRDELRYVLDPAEVMGADYPSETFRVLKNNEIRALGDYRTRNLLLAAYDTLAELGAPLPFTRRDDP